ncbi:MAG TPA: hypothetical protein VGF79_14000 [Bacteroidia bacterium]
MKLQFLFFSFILSFLLSGCNQSEVSINKENCKNPGHYNKVQVFVRSGSGIDKIVAGTDTFYCKPYDPVLELDFDFESIANDSLKVFKEDEICTITQISNTHPSVEIKTNWYGGVELCYCCETKAFD